MMPVVTAVSVWPTCAVPVMVGTPVGAVLVGAATVICKPPDRGTPLRSTTPRVTVVPVGVPVATFSVST